MELKIFQIDAFTDTIFGGNPACIVPLSEWLPDDVLLNIAKENAVAETAFFIPLNDHFHIRWFTPDIEMDLCGHATLATAHVLKAHLDYAPSQIEFESKSGLLQVDKQGSNYTLNFPSRMPDPCVLPEVLQRGMDRQPKEVYKSRDYVLVYEKQEDVVNIKMNRAVLDEINLNPGGIIITAPGADVDFVSRFFTTQSTIFEDPVTGSAHCSLIPFWSKRLNKKGMSALQLSDRVGKLHCVAAGDRVLISGQAKTYMIGNIWTE